MSPFSLAWTYRPVIAKTAHRETRTSKLPYREPVETQPSTGSLPEHLETWLGEGGDAMAVISRKPAGFELHAWWTKRMGQLTPDKRPVYATLEEAQAAANDLVFARVDAWTRLTQDD